MAHAKGHDDQGTLEQMLRAAGLRVTSMRVDVLRMLANSPVALTAADVLDAFTSGKGKSRGQKSAAGAGGGGAKAEAEPVADKVTVYRTLNTLVEANLAHKIDPGDRVFRYSLTDHAHCTDGHHDHEHPHMICERCGAVECIEDAEVVIKPRGSHDHAGGEAKGGAGKNAGEKGTPGTPSKLRRFRVTRQEITLRGTCERCDRAGGGGGAGGA